MAIWNIKSDACSKNLRIARYKDYNINIKKRGDEIILYINSDEIGQVSGYDHAMKAGADIIDAITKKPSKYTLGELRF
jgi:hypothetical protein